MTSVLSATSVVLVQASHLWPWSRAQHGGGALAAQLGDAESARGPERRQAPASVVTVCYPCVRAACTGVSAGVTWLLFVPSLLGALGPLSLGTRPELVLERVQRPPVWLQAASGRCPLQLTLL